jgi:hypothetical protein
MDSWIPRILLPIWQAQQVRNGCKTLTRVVLSAFSLRCLSVTLKVHSHQGGESAPRIPWRSRNRYSL